MATAAHKVSVDCASGHATWVELRPDEQAAYEALQQQAPGTQGAGAAAAARAVAVQTVLGAPELRGNPALCAALALLLGSTP